MAGSNVLRIGTRCSTFASLGAWLDAAYLLVVTCTTMFSFSPLFRGLESASDVDARCVGFKDGKSCRLFCVCCYGDGVNCDILLVSAAFMLVGGTSRPCLSADTVTACMLETPFPVLDLYH